MSEEEYVPALSRGEAYGSLFYALLWWIVIADAAFGFAALLADPDGGWFERLGYLALYFGGTGLSLLFRYGLTVPRKQVEP